VAFAGCVVITAFVGYAGLLYAVYLIPDVHLRLWTAVVVVTGFPVWLMAGPIVYGISSRPPGQSSGQWAYKPPARSVRYRGGIVLFLGVAAWGFGAFVSDLSHQVELVLLAVALLYGFVLGGYWLLSGRKLA